MLARVLAVALCLSVSVTSRSSTTCIMAKRILLVFFPWWLSSTCPAYFMCVLWVAEIKYVCMYV